MIDTSKLLTFRKDLMLGKPGTSDGLQTLSLAAMMGKFERMPPPQTAPLPAVILQTARYPNHQARRALLRLLTGRDGNVTDSMAAAAPHILKHHGIALHPFDFAKLEAFIERHAEHLSQEAREWLRVIKPEHRDSDDSYLDGPITEEFLAQASKAQRLGFLRELRALDPERARGLIESMMPQEAAEMRLRLVKVLNDRLSAGDQPLLESLLKDRAPTVKDLAITLLSRIPGTENFTRQMTRLKEDLQIKTEGLLRRKKVFVYKGPDPKPGLNRFDGLMNGLRLADIAAALGESEASIISIALQSEKMRDLQHLLIRKGVDERNYRLIEPIVDQVNGNDGQLLMTLIDGEFAEKPEADRVEILQLCFTPGKWKELPHQLQYIAPYIPPALPEPIARDLLAQPHWETLAEYSRRTTYEAIAHLIPSSLSAPFMQMAEAHAPRAVFYHRFIQALS